MKHNYFGDHWKVHQCLDIFDAVGEYALEIFDHIDDKYISNFPPILEERNDLSNSCIARIMIKRLGIKGEVRSFNPNTIDIEYLDMLYLRLVGLNNDKLPKASVELASVILKDLNSKYRILSDASISPYVLEHIDQIDQWLEAIDILEVYSAEDALKCLLQSSLRVWNQEDNYFYLVIIAQIAKRYPNLRCEVERLMNEIGIYTIGDPISYILGNISSYPHEMTHILSIDRPKLWFDFPILSSPKIKSTFRSTDHEIIRSTRVILPYRNYKEHINFYRRWKNKETMWYIPTSQYLAEHNFTETTMTMEDVNEDVFIIGYGDSFYSLTEISESIRLNDPIRWDLPNFPSKPTKGDYKDLLTILELTKTHSISSKIQEYEELHMDNLVYDQNKPFLAFFILLVELGLFARRWEGYDKPFPYDSRSADRIDVNPEDDMLPRIVKIRNIIEKWDEDIDFKVYSNGNVTGKSLKKYLNEIIQGEECIRMASTKLINTGIHYLNTLYQTNYKNPLTGEVLEVKKLEPILLNSPEEQLSLRQILSLR